MPLLEIGIMKVTKYHMDGFYDIFISPNGDKYFLNCFKGKTKTFNIGDYVGQLESLDYGLINPPYIIVLDSNLCHLLVDIHGIIHRIINHPLKGIDALKCIGYTIWDRDGNSFQEHPMINDLML